MSVALFGVSPTAIRLLPALEMGLIVILITLITRDLGGSRRAQVLAAITAALSGYLGAGHLDTTTDLDLLAWAIILWLLVKLLAGGDRRLWLAVGVVAGIGLENKDTILFLGAGLAVGLVLARRWDVVRSPWAWAAIGIALLLWAPNLAWQAANGWPQVTMASPDRRQRRRQPLPDRAVPLAFCRPIPLPGGHRRLGMDAIFAKAAAPWRVIGIAAVVALVLVVVSGGKDYYAIGLVAPSWQPALSSSIAGSPAVTARLRATSFRRRRRLRPARRVSDSADPASGHVRQDVASSPVPSRRAGRLAAVRLHGGGRGGHAAGGRASPRGDPDQRLQRGEPARAPRQGAASGLLGPQRLLVVGTPASRPHGRGARW